MRLKFDSSVKNLESVNDSFGRGVMRVCYCGENRNGTDITKEALEKAIPSAYNCPVVCNYDVATDSIGGHDLAVVKDADGNSRLINLTDAVGVVPADAARDFETVTDGDGISRDYFTLEVILWKRSSAYRKIESDKITSLSMEINVKDGHMSEGVYVVDDFSFTAFCLLGDDIEPCFESASLEVFEANYTKERFSEMMKELKETFSLLPAFAGGDMNIRKLSEGGEKKLEELKNTAMGGDIAPQNEDKRFSLEKVLRDELQRTVESEKAEEPFEFLPRYSLIDYDPDNFEVYAFSTDDGCIYGFKYEKNGDAVSVDFSNARRMKIAFEPFENGEYVSPLAPVIEMGREEFMALKQSQNERIDSMEEELESLRRFKEDTQRETRRVERERIFSLFKDLEGVSEFENLREDSERYSKDELMEKCYAIRGRNVRGLSFGANTGSPKLPVEPKADLYEDEPYGGIFLKYGISGDDK